MPKETKTTANIPQEQCAQCGAGIWGAGRVDDTTRLRFCSWHCQREWREEKGRE